MIITLPQKYRADVAKLGINVGGAQEEGLEGASFGVDVRLLDSGKLDEFYNWLKTQPDTRTARIHINSYKAGRDAPKGAKIETMRAAAAAMTDYIVSNAIEGWLFRIDDNPIAGLVTNVEFFPPVKKRDHEREAYIEVTMVSNDRGKTRQDRFTCEAGKSNGLTVEEMIRNSGWQKETAELHQLYREQLERYKVIRPLYGKQLVMTKGRNYEADEEDEYGRRRSYGFNRRRKASVDLMKDNAGRLVHNEPVETGAIKVKSYRFDDPDNPYVHPSLQAVIERDLGEKTTAFSKAPFQMLLGVYHLGQHTEYTAHVADVEVYKYNEKIRDSLVLEPLYNEVLDVLTHDMLLVQEDVIAGKTGGNVILLAGPPGTGKTLTAEVFAEHKKVPLLKIHSGQLGTEAEGIEQKVLAFYQKATAWGIPVLLDEFDVFGRARANDLRQNAVVAVFLRTLEYQNNTLFLTTNRADTMDDAILSRCAAIIKYDYPTGQVLTDIWKAQRNQFLPNLKDEHIMELMEFFSADKKQMAGRDVKNIMRLADRYERTGRSISVELMKTCAGFRGV